MKWRAYPTKTFCEAKCLIIAHRGSSACAPESTAEAIRKAMALKADMVELDVQLTRDRRLVVFHDERLERTTNGQGRLADWRFRDLARLDAGSWFGWEFAGSRMLLLSQALRLVPPPRCVNLEIKHTSHRSLVVRRLVACLRWTRMVRRVLISSFDAALLERVRARAPSIARAFLCRKDARRAVHQAVRLGCVAIHPHQSLVDATLVRQAHRAGLRVHVWTVDGAAEAKRLVRLGVDGVVTNLPDRIRTVGLRLSGRRGAR